MKKMRMFLIIIALLFLILLCLEFGIVKGSPLGYIGISIDVKGFSVTIHEPLNVSYNYAIGSNYTLNLNVSSTGEVVHWWYRLEDIKHQVFTDVDFYPNTTFNAVRWGNKLTVYGDIGNDHVASDEVSFFVNVPDSAPLIWNITNRYVCENAQVNFDINVTNLDEDPLDYSLYISDPIFVFRGKDIDYTTNQFFISSFNLSKSYVGNHTYNFSVNDGTYSDSRMFNLSVIEVNRMPYFEDLGVKTLYVNGDNSTFEKQWDVNDIEDGNSSLGNMGFNISFSGETLFDINKFGVMNFTANSSYMGVHNVTVCATDRSLSKIHPNISLCGVDGLNNSVCDEFSITVTDENRAPLILNYYPQNLSFVSAGDNVVYFNITTYDPEHTVADAYWYYDDVLVEYDSGSLVDEFSLNFPCGVSGSHNVSVLVTDGLNSTNMSWDFIIYNVDCEEPGKKGGGGGGGGMAACTPNIACSLWSTCESLEKSYIGTAVSSYDYLEIKRNCSFVGFDDKSCGYQLRSCFDMNVCSKESIPQKSMCQYIDNPNCKDNIKNCHDGNCEVLVDCGGPCSPCNTCSDGIMNQEESGIDCGGPCPVLCKEDKPGIKKEELKYTIYLIVGILLLLLIILVVLNIMRVIKIKNEIGELNWYELLRSKKKR